MQASPKLASNPSVTRRPREKRRLPEKSAQIEQAEIANWVCRIYCDAASSVCALRLLVDTRKAFIFASVMLSIGCHSFGADRADWG